MLPQLDVAHYISSVFWLFLSLAVLFAFVQFWLIPRIDRLALKRAAIVDEKLNEIAAIRANITSSNEIFENAIQKAHSEALKMQSDMVKAFNEESDQAFNEANAKFNLLVERERKKLRTKYEAFMKNKNEVANYLAKVFLSHFGS